MSDRPERLTRRVGGDLREAAVLLTVFGMLDKYVHEGGPTLAWTASVLGFALFFYVLGLIIEGWK